MSAKRYCDLCGVEAREWGGSKGGGVVLSDTVHAILQRAGIVDGTLPIGTPHRLNYPLQRVIGECTGHANDLCEPCAGKFIKAVDAINSAARDIFPPLVIVEPDHDR